MVRKPKDESATEKPANLTLITIGFLAGFLSGLTGAVGLLFNRFYFRYNLSKNEIIATRAANEILLHIIKIVLYYFFGLLSAKIIYAGITIAAAGIASTFIIKNVLPYISENIFRKIGYAAMIFSSFVMLFMSGKALANQNNAQLSANPITKGIEMKLDWQQSDYALEFTYDEGFEFEQVIPFTELTKTRQKKVLSYQPADRIIIEIVYSFSSPNYEAYYFRKNKLVNKLNFE